MKIFSFLGKHLFWVLQILGWGIFAAFIAYAEFTAGSSFPYILLLSISFSIAGIVFTSIYRWLLKKYTTLNFNLKNSSKVVGIAFLCCVVFVLLLNIVDNIIVLEEAVKSTENHNKNHEENHYSFTVGPLFFSLFILSIWTFLYYIIKAVRKQNNNRIERLRLREKIKSAQLNTLQGHVNGKFLIEVLHRIKKQMPLDTKKARGLLTDLSELLRYSLSNQNVTNISISDEIEMVEKYIGLYQIDNPNTIKLEYKLESEFLQNEIPPMVLISMLELILGDTVLEDITKKVITLKSKNTNDSIQVILSVNAKIGIHENDIRFRKINQRLWLLYSSYGKLSLNQLQNAIELDIPRYSNGIEEK